MFHTLFKHIQALFVQWITFSLFIFSIFRFSILEYEKIKTNMKQP